MTRKPRMAQRITAPKTGAGLAQASMVATHNGLSLACSSLTMEALA